jgi:hypothetical protein
MVLVQHTLSLLTNNLSPLCQNPQGVGCLKGYGFPNPYPYPVYPYAKTLRVYPYPWCTLLKSVFWHFAWISVNKIGRNMKKYVLGSYMNPLSDLTFTYSRHSNILPLLSPPPMHLEMTLNRIWFKPTLVVLPTDRPFSRLSTILLEGTHWIKSPYYWAG